MENRKVKRGEIYLYDFGVNEGSIQNGTRPVLIVQCDDGNQASQTTVIAAITTAIKKRYMPSHIILGANYGLSEPSMVLLEQLRTINQSELIKYIGNVDSEYTLKQINIGLKKAMGLWVDRPPKRQQTVRCLCSKCLNDYKKNPDMIVRRLDPFAKVKEECVRCGAAGWDYIIIEKKHSEKAEKRCHDEQRENN